MLQNDGYLMEERDLYHFRSPLLRDFWFNRFVKWYIVLLLRDKLNRLQESKLLFDALEKSDLPNDMYLLDKSLFAYYERTLETAESFLRDALSAIGDSLPSFTTINWYRSAGIVIKLGFSGSLLKVFQATSHNTLFKPFYIAIEALSKTENNQFLNSITAEVREPAKQIIEKISNYMK